MPKTSEQVAGGDNPHGRTDDPVTPWRELLHALRVQASMPRTWPALLFIASAAILTAVLPVWAVVAASIPEGASILPSWLIITCGLSALYMLVLVIRLDDGRREVEAWLHVHGTRLKPGLGAAEDRLLREVLDQCRSLGISRVPDVHLYDPEVSDWGAFAHAGLLDEGRVGIPEPWLHEHPETALRSVIGHELSHILHRDRFVKEVVDAFATLFLGVPSHLCAMFAKMIFGATALLVLVFLLLAVALSIVAMDVGPLLTALSGIPESFLEILNLPYVKWTVVIAANGAIAVGGMVLYRLWVGRRQELVADETASRIAGAAAAWQGIDLVVRLEGAAGEGPGPITPERCRAIAVGAMVGLAESLLPFLPWRGDTRGGRLALSPVAWIGERAGDGLWLGARVLSRLPGAEAVRHAAWRLTRTHPTPGERKRRIERLLTASP